MINPGASSEHGVEANEEQPAKAGNHDSGIIISDNQITDYGYGHEYWNWGGMHNDGGSSYVIALLDKQLEENPEISDVLIQGNIVFNSGRDGVVVDGALVKEPPRYRYALCIQGDPTGPHFPKNVQVRNNIFHPGKDGVCNQDLALFQK